MLPDVRCRYGVKVGAVALLQEWVRDIGSHAGLTAFNTQINSGSLGVPESRMEVRGGLARKSDRSWSVSPPH